MKNPVDFFYDNRYTCLVAATCISILYFIYMHFRASDFDLDRLLLTIVAVGTGVLFYGPVIAIGVRTWRRRRSISGSTSDVDSIHGPALRDPEQLIAILRQEVIDEQRRLTERNAETIQQQIEQIKSQQHLDFEKQYGSFEGYFSSMRARTDGEIDRMLRQATLLLERGIAIGVGGALGYLGIIYIWHTIWIMEGKGTNWAIIIGAVSTSLLFLAVEFLAAWFLKQYRQFTDGALYLSKIRAIFDRHMLAYLVCTKEHTEATRAAMLPFLSAPIIWPEAPSISKPDATHANELSQWMKDMTAEMARLKNTR